MVCSSASNVIHASRINQENQGKTLSYLLYSNTMNNPSLTLRPAQLAALFKQLLQLESAGLPAIQAFALLAESDTSLKVALILIQRNLKAGMPISEAGFRAKVFDDTLRALVHAAESSGRLTEVYDQLAKYYSCKAARDSKVRSRMWLPGITFAIALFVKPLPALISDQISSGDYLYLTLGQFAMLAVLIILLMRLPGILHNASMGELWDRLLLAIPVVGRHILARQLNEFFFTLSLLLEGGLAFSEALPKAIATIRNEALKAKFSPALAMLNSGASVATTLEAVSAIDGMMLGVVNSSEQSGDLAGGISQYNRLKAEILNHQDDELATWLPRLAYALVAGWMISSLL